jgi:hypothetical protein
MSRRLLPGMPALAALLAVLLAGVLAPQAPRLAAQDYTITRTVFIPAIYHVGDEVELRLGIRSDFAAKMVVPQNLAQPSWGTIRNLALLPHEDEVELRLKFTCFSVGTHSLPALNVGPVVLEGINVFVASLAGTGVAGLEPLREQAAIPDTWWRLLAQAGIVILAPAGLAACLLWGWPWLGHYRRIRREQRPFRQLLRRLQAGREGLAALDGIGFYAWLMAEIRQYLAERWQVPAMAATSAELAGMIRGRIHHQATVDRLVAVFIHADRVRFAGELASAQACLEELELVEAALGHIEQEERMRRRSGLAGSPKNVVRASLELGRRVREHARPAGGTRDSL